MVGDIAPLGRDEFDLGYRTLQDVFSNINNQLQFAEAKNAGLLATNLALIVGVGAILAAETVQHNNVKLWLYATCFGLAMAGFVALMSILPIYGLERHELITARDIEGKNLFFFGDIHGAAPDAYAKAIFSALSLAGTPSRLHIDLANQVVINAGIANRKFALFKVAAILTAVAVIIPAVAFGFIVIGQGGELR